MSDNYSFWNELKGELGQVGRVIVDAWRTSGVTIRNQIRRLSRRQVKYIVIPLGGSMPERNPPPRRFIERWLPLPAPPMSLETLHHQFQAISDADNVEGVVIILRRVQAGLARLQNLRRAIARLRENGKQVIIYTPYLDMSHYFVATAADVIIAPPSAQFDALGLNTETIFLKNALDKLGVQVDIVAISPYKTAGNLFGESEVTPEQREQMTWLLDEAFELMIGGMAEGRGQSPAEMGQAIDRAPMTVSQACEMSLVDHVAYEDELEGLFGRLHTWEEVCKHLTEKPRRRSRSTIGIVSLEGTIVMGNSERAPIDIPLPFIGGKLAGEQTLLQQLRLVEKDDSMAGLIFYVDSGGGSALASDLIWRQVQRISRKKPVLAYMGEVAASGGYYVAAAANHIMAQSGTITGSIGVIMGHFTSTELYQHLGINRFHLSRGQQATLYRDLEPLSSEERAILQQSVDDIYHQFKTIVAEGRNIPIQQLDPICQGRVWTGRQAERHGLLDSHGDFIDAIERVKALAGLPSGPRDRVPVINIRARGRETYRLPQPAEDLTALASRLMGQSLMDFNGKPIFMMPYELRWR